MKKTSTSLALLALTSLISAPSAQAGIFDFDPAESSAYVSGFVGIAFQGDADFDGVQAPAAGVPGAVGAPAEIQADFDNDIYFGGRNQSTQTYHRELLMMAVKLSAGLSRRHIF